MGVWGSGDAMTGRSPHGERGLKFHHHGLRDRSGQSLSSRRAWIEIQLGWRFVSKSDASLSSRRAWIEIDEESTPYEGALVALLTESVD